jgi:transcriptional regulator with XRE-family HTH domain
MESEADPRLVALGDAVRELRESVGESQVAAAALGMDQGFLRGIESGQRNFSIERLFVVADHYRVHPRELFNTSPDASGRPGRFRRRRGVAGFRGGAGA